MHRADRYLLPRLAIIDSRACEAYREQCYQWWAGIDAPTTQDFAEQQHIMDKANEAIAHWFDAKRLYNIPIPVEKEAEALLTRLASANSAMREYGFYERYITRSYTLLPLLPASSLKTRLMAHLAWYCNDAALMRQVRAAFSNDNITPDDRFVLSPDDRFVLSLLREFDYDNAGTLKSA
jgi:hypothetical protein